MEHQNYTIWIEAEEWVPGTWASGDTNADVIVMWEDGTRWVATFVSYKNVTTLTEKDKRSGECLSGAYFWTSDMLLVDCVSRQRIEEVIDHLIQEGSFEVIFTRLPPEEI